MKPIRRQKRARQSENTVPLINIVFLMLIFFVIAGRLAPPIEAGISLIRTEAADPADVPDALVLLADGTMRYRGRETTPEAHVVAMSAGLGTVGEPPEIRVLPDRNLAATRLLETAAALKKAGAGKIIVMTERGEP